MQARCFVQVVCRSAPPSRLNPRCLVHPSQRRMQAKTRRSSRRHGRIAAIHRGGVDGMDGGFHGANAGGRQRRAAAWPRALLRRRARLGPGASLCDAPAAYTPRARRVARPRSRQAHSLTHGVLTLVPLVFPQALGATWASWGYDVAHESFLCAPHAFLGAIPLAALAWVRALRSYDAQPRAAFVAAATGVSIFVLEVVMYREALEVLQMFPVAQGTARRLRTSLPVSFLALTRARLRHQRGGALGAVGRAASCAAADRVGAPRQARQAAGVSPAAFA